MNDLITDAYTGEVYLYSCLKLVNCRSEKCIVKNYFRLHMVLLSDIGSCLHPEVYLPDTEG
jgi:hypothetical protein